MCCTHGCLTEERGGTVQPELVVESKQKGSIMKGKKGL